MCTLGCFSPSATSISHEAAEQAEVSLVLRQFLSLRGFEDHGMVSEAGIIDKDFETGTADLTPADMLMPVQTGTKRVFGIVQMEKPQLFQTDG